MLFSSVVKFLLSRFMGSGVTAFRCDFDHASKVPDNVAERITAWGTGFLTTKIVEDGIHEVKRRASGTDKQAISRPHRWTALIESDKLNDINRSEAQISQADKASALVHDTTKDIFYDPL